MDLERRFQEEFKCPKCGRQGAVTKEVSMTGTGLSRLLDLEYNRYLFVSCQTCGFTEVYNSKILGKNGVAMDILDLFFG